MTEEIVKVVPKEPSYHIAQQIVYYLAGAVEVLLAFRLVFKMAGANLGSGFVAFIYDFSNFFVLPFRSIFGNATAPGAETTGVFEPATLIAMIVVAIVAMAIAKLIAIMVGRPHDVE